MKTYFYCKTDLNGQRTGETESINLSEDQITYDFHIKERANKLHKGIFLYESNREATRAATN